MGRGSEVDSRSEAVPDLGLLQLLMSSLYILSAGVSQRLASVLKPLSQVWPNYVDFISLIQLEPAPVQEHEETVKLGYVLAPVGVEVNSNRDIIEVTDGPQVGGNQRADVCWEDGLQLGEEGIVRDAADAGARELAYNSDFIILKRKSNCILASPALSHRQIVLLIELFHNEIAHRVLFILQ